MRFDVRAEDSADIAAIRSVTERAFRDMPYAGGDEQDVIDRLRSAGALPVSLVAVVGDEVVGHVAFSPAKSTDSTQPWFTLGPVAVHPDCQLQGIGSALIERGLADIARLGALGCIVVGNPDYYERFGFEPAPQQSPQKDYADFFMIKCFSVVRPAGAIDFHDAFYGDT